MKSIIQEERLSDLIKNSLNLMCKTSLSYDTEVEIKGLLGITLDKKNVFLVDVKEIITSGDYSEDEVEVEQEYEITPTKPSPVNKKADGGSPRNTKASKRSKRTIKEKPIVEPKKRKYATGAQAQQRSALLYSMAASGVSNGESREDADFSLSKVKEEDHEEQSTLNIIRSAVDSIYEPDYNDQAVNDEDDVEDNDEDNAHDGDNDDVIDDVIDDNDDMVPDNDDDDESTDVEENAAALDYKPNTSNSLNNEDEERFTQLNTPPPTVSTSADVTENLKKEYGTHSEAVILPVYNNAQDVKESNSKEKKKPYSCPQCPKTFLTKKSCKLHIKGYHGPGWTCSVCNRHLKSYERFRKHLWTHAETFPFNCDQCGKGFVTKVSLDTHMQGHMFGAQIAYECQRCSKKLASKKSLDTHAKRCGATGEPERKNACGLCFKTFVNKQSLRIHELNKHKGYEHPCLKCGKKFKYPTGLIRHLKTCDIVKDTTCDDFKSDYPKGDTYSSTCLIPSSSISSGTENHNININTSSTVDTSSLNFETAEEGHEIYLSL